MPDVPRAHNGRPWIAVPGEDKLQSYSRTSLRAHDLSDSYALDLHHQKEVAIGLSENGWLLNKVSESFRPLSSDDDPWGEAVRTDHYDHNELVRWLTVASAKAGSDVKSEYGTRMHELTQKLDEGEDIDWDNLPDRVFGDLMAYSYYSGQLEILDAEQFVVNDVTRDAGTFDRRVKLWGKKRIADLKTGLVKGMEFEMQLADYARSELYNCLHEPILDENGKLAKAGCEGSNLTAHKRSPLGVETDWGIIFHLPAGSGQMRFLKADLNRGWENVQLAAKVREARKIQLEEIDLTGEEVA